MLPRKPIFGPSEVAEIASLLTAENLPIYIVALLLNVDRMTLAKWREEHTGPPFVRLKRGVIAYPREAFSRFLKAAHQARFEVKTPEPKPRKQLRRILSHGGLHGTSKREPHS